jgi:hypothetical protein
LEVYYLYFLSRSCISKEVSFQVSVCVGMILWTKTSEQCRNLLYLDKSKEYFLLAVGTACYFCHELVQNYKNQWKQTTKSLVMIKFSCKIVHLYIIIYTIQKLASIVCFFDQCFLKTDWSVSEKCKIFKDTIITVKEIWFKIVRSIIFSSATINPTFNGQ